MSKGKSQKLGIKGLGQITFIKSRKQYRGRGIIGKTDSGNPKYKTVFGKTKKEVIKK